jgi:hypothetical protein
MRRKKIIYKSAAVGERYGGPLNTRQAQDDQLIGALPRNRRRMER